MNESRWNPRRRGKVYCSPACGGGVKWGCTVERHRAATKIAESMCRRLGKGWMPHVFENLGWHARAVRGPFSVARDASDRYTVSHYRRGVLGEGSTPKAAIGSMIERLWGERQLAESILVATEMLKT